jgi:Zn-dependent membrane protease YugP
MPFFFFDPTMILLVPAMILAFWAQSRVRSVYKKYQAVPSQTRLTGKDVAERLLSLNRISDVQVRPHQGMLSDHYDPRNRTVNLSPHNYSTNSIAAISVAAHEVGHAIQDAHAYVPMRVRHAIVPVANIGSSLGLPLFLVGFFFAAKLQVLMDVGIALFAGAVVFHLVTLPVEFDASRRALRQLQGSGTLPSSEIAQARQVLGAAALTYVAAMAVAASHLLRLLLLRSAASRD